MKTYELTEANTMSNEQYEQYVEFLLEQEVTEQELQQVYDIDDEFNL